MGITCLLLLCPRRKRYRDLSVCLSHGAAAVSARVRGRPARVGSLVGGQRRLGDRRRLRHADARRSRPVALLRRLCSAIRHHRRARPHHRQVTQRRAHLPRSHHEVTMQLPGQRDIARNNARCTLARKATRGFTIDVREKERNQTAISLRGANLNEVFNENYC